MSRGSSTSVLTLNVGKRQKRSVESDSQVHSLLQFRFLISFEGNTSKSLPFVVCDALFVFWRGPIKKGQRGYRVFLGIRRPPSFCLRQWEPCVYFWETSTSFLCLFFKWRVHSYPFTGPGSCPGISRKRLLLPILLVLRGWWLWVLVSQTDSDSDLVLFSFVDVGSGICSDLSWFFVYCLRMMTHTPVSYLFSKEKFRIPVSLLDFDMHLVLVTLCRRSLIRDWDLCFITIYLNFGHYVVPFV